MNDVLLTGFPTNELARRVLERLLETDPDAMVTCLVPERFMERAHVRLEMELMAHRERLVLLEGDVAALDLGLSGAEYLSLAERVRVIHHCAAVTYTGAPAKMAERVNVQGSAEVFELGRAAKRLERIVLWSTTAATGERDGVVWEDELLDPHASRLVRTRYRAERLALRARGDVPVTVLRPAMLAGDSKTGVLSRIEGPHLLVSVLLTAPRDVPIPRLARGDSPLHVVPIDYAVEAGLAISRAKDTISRTFQIVDPSPVTVHQALTMIAMALGKPPPRGGLPPPLARALVRIPLIERVVHAERALLDELARDVRLDDSNARPVLTRAGLSCPSFASYVDKIVAHVSHA